MELLAKLTHRYCSSVSKSAKRPLKGSKGMSCGLQNVSLKTGTSTFSGVNVSEILKKKFSIIKFQNTVKLGYNEQLGTGHFFVITGLTCLLI